MAMRLSGLMSGMDTDSIVQQLVEAKRTKVDDAEKAKIKLEWKQDAWKELNKKLKSFQNKYLSEMRFSSAYMKKTTKVSDSSVADVITGENAMNSVQSMQVTQLAKTAYLTGAKIKGADGSGLTATDKIKDIDPSFDGGTIKVKVGGETKAFTIEKDATISDVLNNLKTAGLNASFDATNQRIFVSAKESGEANNFEISGSDEMLQALGLNANAPTKDAFIAGLSEDQKANADELWKEEQQKYAVKIEGQDAKMLLNGAEFSSKSNVFEVNGLTITALRETAEGEAVTLTTEEDTEGIYDMIKEFITEYSALINEMDALYNADSAKGYEPLTTEEKEALTETEIEEWEEKIKGSLLRRDESVNSVSSALKSVMLAGVEVNGKKMYLSDFGINTLGYFDSEDNERNAYHINGDEDDDYVSGEANDLMNMITADPDKVVSFFTQLSQNLYSKMSDLSTSMDGYRSYGSFYYDKKLESDYEDYEDKIADLEEKLTAYEDKWYDKFAAMEAVMAKMQNNANAVASLLGGA